MRYFKQSIRITPNKMYAAAPIFKGRSQVEFGGQRVTMAMRNRNEMYNVKEYVDGMPTFIHQFDGVTPLMIDFKWEIDPNTNKIKESDKQKREAAVLNFLKFHENIVWKKDIDSLGNISKSAGNVNLKKALFIIEILEDTLNNEIQRWEKELKVRCIVNDMTEEQRVELCYFYGLNPNGMIDGETKVALAGKSGVAVNNENIDDFLDIGAYDGIALSNTYALVLDGWSGVMIEGSPMTYELLKKNITQESVTLIHALVDVEESREVKFFDNTEATATMNIGNYEKWLKATPFHECTMMTTPISEILDEHGYAYDLVSIDVEGGSADLFRWMSARMPDVKVWVVEHDGQDLQLEGYQVLDRNGENLIFGRPEPEREWRLRPRERFAMPWPRASRSAPRHSRAGAEPSAAR